MTGTEGPGESGESLFVIHTYGHADFDGWPEFRGTTDDEHIDAESAGESRIQSRASAVKRNRGIL